MSNKTYYFTYGAGHVTLEGASLGQCYTPIQAPTAERAGMVMIALRGREWSHQYSSLEAAGVYEFGLQEVSVGEVVLGGGEL